MTTLTDIIASLTVSASRRESLRLAAEAGADEALVRRLAAANRLARASTIVLPARYMGLSRSRGWARLGKGSAARWGESDGTGFRVAETGTWTVFSTDGFSREEKETWKVAHVAVGDSTWTVAS